MFVRYRKSKKNYGAIIAIVIATISSVISLGLFFYRFGFDFSATITDWINTATYFNNLLSPIFLFITILLLYWTWRDTKEALEIQSNELSLQRRELKSNRSIHEKQLQTQKRKDDLDIFSRRINELDKNFVSVLSERDLMYILPRFLAALHNNNLLEDCYIKVMDQVRVVEPDVKQMTMNISKYIYNETFNTDDAIKDYLKLSITHNKQCLLAHLFEIDEHRSHIFTVMIGQILINSNIFKRRVNTLERLLGRIDRVSIAFSHIYIEELELHFDIEIIFLLSDAGYLNIPEGLDTVLREL
ncbi:hypothetical protein PNIG_a2053 [Pseudoalteromonas nigrifaciens]|uniref:Phage abortive infection protein n=2 Tax=Pseudoalteromonas TaxID=53246 RepID=A0AAC9UIT4_9GAMM|nr:hypothetical protein PNIG_a2053 [Pseudoalteromonas nigrifaciens]GEN42572.1 hypothetical protein PNI02_20380 [Pseudoalteromonas nigrifaciens]SUC52055.1 Uncharacterised protein [Pseudoalteromonas nigrifaciens]|tara:strand:+ start:6103 stop:7002 length:900 start_codon:yes stop_codon:yes gene_type:complete